MIKKRLIFGLVLILSVATFVTAYAYTNRDKSNFNENTAIVFALGAHNREVEEVGFPEKDNEIKTVEINVGGNQVIPVELSTNIEKVGEEIYNVTFTKVWKAEKDVISYWSYRVVPKEIDLIENQNNVDALLQ